MDLEKEIYSPILSHHLFFACYSEVDESAIRKLCHTGISRIDLSEGDTLFHQGDPSSSMFFVLKGCLQYQAGKSADGRAVSNLVKPDQKGRTTIHRSALGTSKIGGYKPKKMMAADGREILMLKNGYWCCEACLWVDGWHHQGVMVAQDDSSVLVLNAEVFVKVTSSHAKIAPHACKYATVFLEKMTEMLHASDNNPEVAGLDVVFTNDDLLLFVEEAFPLDVQSTKKNSIALGIKALKQGRRKTPMHKQLTGALLGRKDTEFHSEFKASVREAPEEPSDNRTGYFLQAQLSKAMSSFMSRSSGGQFMSHTATEKSNFSSSPQDSQALDSRGYGREASDAPRGNDETSRSGASFDPIACDVAPDKGTGSRRAASSRSVTSNENEVPHQVNC